MSLGTVKRRIEQDLQQQIEKLREETAQAIKKIDDQTREEISRYKQAYSLETEAILDRMQTREKLSTQLGMKKIMLEARRIAIQDTFEAAQHALLQEESRYMQFLWNQLKIARRILNVHRISCDPHDEPVIQALLDQMQLVHPVHLHLQKIPRGFIAEDERGVRFDATLPAVFEQMARQHTAEITRILWGRKGETQGLEPDEEEEADIECMNEEEAAEEGKEEGEENKEGNDEEKEEKRNGKGNDEEKEEKRNGKGNDGEREENGEGTETMANSMDDDKNRDNDNNSYDDADGTDEDIME